MSPQNQQGDFLRPSIVGAFVLTALIWGGTWFAIKDQLSAAPVPWSVTWRFTVAALGMAILILIRRKSFRLSLSGHVFAFCFGVTQFSINFNLLYQAERHLTSGLVAVVFGLLMLPNALLARIFLGHRVPPGFIGGTAIATLGIALLLAHEVQTAPPHGQVWLGIGLCFASLLTASSANVMQAGETARKEPILTMLVWSMAWGAGANFVYAWVMEGPPVLPLEPRYLTGVAYLGIMGSVVTFPLYFHLVRELGAGRAAYNGVAVPIVAMGISTLLEGYDWSLLSVSGAVLALLGMVLALRARKPLRKVT